MMHEKNGSLNKIIQNIGWLVFDKLFILLMNIFVIFIVANHYGSENYGLYQYATSIVIIIEVIVQLIDGRVVKKRYEENDADSIVYNVTISKVLLSIVALLFGSVIVIAFNKDREFCIILLILLVDSILKNMRFGMENRFEYILQSKRVVIAADAGLLVGTFLQIAAVMCNKSIMYIAAIQGFSTVISLFVLFYQYKHFFKLSIISCDINTKLIKQIIVESIPLAIAATASTIYTKCDSVMLGMLLTTSEVGIYSISSKFVSTIQLIIIPIQTTIFVKMIEWKNNKEKYEKNYIRITSLATWMSIFVILLSYILLPVIFKLLNPEYLPAIRSYKILSIGSVFAYNAILRSSHFTLIDRGDILMRVQIGTVIINIILNFVLISKLGMDGAAVATVCAQFLSLFLSNILYEDSKFVLKNQIMGFNPKYIFKK